MGPEERYKSEFLNFGIVKVGSFYTEGVPLRTLLENSGIQMDYVSVLGTNCDNIPKNRI
jgi:hypothetical protein